MFYLYNRPNRARALAHDLGVTRYYPYEYRIVRRKRQFRRTMRVGVNWGCVRLSEYPRFHNDEDILNCNLRVASSKIETFSALDIANVPHPRMFASAEEATASGVPFLGRTDRLCAGRGITIYEAGSVPQRHDFYVAVIPCRREFRVHVFQDKAIAIQKKLVANATSIIHNHDNGVTFQYFEREALNRYGPRTMARMIEMAIEAVRAVGLDFGAVDIIQEQETSRLYVLEVNSAPGIRTEQIYIAYLNEFAQFVEE